MSTHDRNIDDDSRFGFGRRLVTFVSEQTLPRNRPVKYLANYSSGAVTGQDQTIKIHKKFSCWICMGWPIHWSGHRYTTGLPAASPLDNCSRLQFFWKECFMPLGMAMTIYPTIFRHCRWCLGALCCISKRSLKICHRRHEFYAALLCLSFTPPARNTQKGTSPPTCTHVVFHTIELLEPSNPPAVPLRNREPVR